MPYFAELVADAAGEKETAWELAVRALKPLSQAELLNLINECYLKLDSNHVEQFNWRW